MPVTNDAAVAAGMVLSACCDGVRLIAISTQAIRISTGTTASNTDSSVSSRMPPTARRRWSAAEADAAPPLPSQLAPVADHAADPAGHQADVLETFAATDG